MEILESGWFALNEIPELSTERNTREQMAMCFEAYKDPNWQVVVD